MKNKFFNKNRTQERIEFKINKYKESFKDIAIQNTIDQMPKTQETLDIIEQELSTVVEGLDGTEKEKWEKAVNGLNYLAGKRPKPRLTRKQREEIMSKGVEE